MTASLCGVLLGGSAAIFLVAGGLDPKKREEAFPLIRELLAWYEQKALPDYRLKNPKFQIRTSVARSPLCHVSVTRWSEVAGFKLFSKERSERCGRLTASVVTYTAETLNANFPPGAMSTARDTGAGSHFHFSGRAPPPWRMNPAGNLRGVFPPAPGAVAGGPGLPRVPGDPCGGPGRG